MKQPNSRENKVTMVTWHGPLLLWSWISQSSNGTAKHQTEQPNIEWNSQTSNARSNGTAKCQMEQANVEWNRQTLNGQTTNGTAKRRMEQPNDEWNRQTSNGTDKCRMEQTNVEWNSKSQMDYNVVMVTTMTSILTLVFWRATVYALQLYFLVTSYCNKKILNAFCFSNF